MQKKIGFRVMVSRVNGVSLRVTDRVRGLTIRLGLVLGLGLVVAVRAGHYYRATLC